LKSTPYLAIDPIQIAYISSAIAGPGISVDVESSLTTPSFLTSAFADDNRARTARDAVNMANRAKTQLSTVP